MNSSDHDDIRHELSRAADLQLTTDYTAQVWEQGQRQRWRTTLAIGAGMAACVAALAVFAGQGMGTFDSAPPIEPAGTGDRGVTGAATSSRPDDGAAVTTDGAVAVTTRPPDASDSAPDSDPIPLGHGIVMTPIPGWQVVHDRDLAAGADPESTAFISCPVKEGSIFETLTDCEHGWQIWTGWDDVEPPPENPFTSAAVWDPELSVAASDQSTGLPEFMVTDALMADPGSVDLTSRFVDLAEMGQTDLSAEVVEYSFADQQFVPTGETLSLTLTDDDTVLRIGPNESG